MRRWTRSRRDKKRGGGDTRRGRRNGRRLARDRGGRTCLGLNVWVFSGFFVHRFYEGIEKKIGEEDRSIVEGELERTNDC